MPLRKIPARTYGRNVYFCPEPFRLVDAATGAMVSGTCIYCGALTPVADLARDGAATGGYRLRCRPCSALIAQEFYEPRERKPRSTRPPKPCTVDGCAAPLKARGLCMRHYGRAHRAGVLA